jgi:hypothetical protein
MTDRTTRDQADAPLRSAETLAGGAPLDPVPQDGDAVPLEAGAVRNGGAYRGGKSPEASSGEQDETREPLDSRTHFGGDGALFVDETGTAGDGGRPGTAPDDDGYDPAAGGGAAQEA